MTANELWQQMTALTQTGPVRNFTAEIDLADFTVETELFSKSALEAYTAWNLEKDISESQKTFFDSTRGGSQGDYREGMADKIANVVDCLSRFPQSKRAVITISNTAFACHEKDAEAKCLREIHLHLDEKGSLNGTAFFRAQAAQIFPKNIHFIGSLMQEVAEALPQKASVGRLYYVATVLVSDRS